MRTETRLVSVSQEQRKKPIGLTLIASATWESPELEDDETEAGSFPCPYGGRCSSAGCNGGNNCDQDIPTPEL